MRVALRRFSWLVNVSITISQVEPMHRTSGEMDLLQIDASRREAGGETEDAFDEADLFGDVCARLSRSLESQKECLRQWLMN